MKIDVTASFQQNKNLGNYESLKVMCSVTFRDVYVTKNTINKVIKRESDKAFAELRKAVKTQLERGEIK